MTNESQLQVRRKADESSLSLSKVRSTLIARGRRDAGMLHAETTTKAVNYSERFDHVFCGPDQRDMETAAQFGDPIVLKGLDAWRRGAHEGQPAKLVEDATRSLIQLPDSKPPGKSPISGLPGESYNEFLRPLTHVMCTMKEHLKPQERILVVISGDQLQAIDQLAASGFPTKPNQNDLDRIEARPYWKAIGTLFLLTEKGLENALDNKEPGIYCHEDSSAAFDQNEE